MKKLTLTALALSSSLLSASAVQAAINPFGIAKGTSIDQLLKMGGIYNPDTGLYRVNKPPTPNSSFDFYLVRATKTHGVCYVSGVGKTIVTNAYGDQLVSAFEGLEKSLLVKYGKAKQFDFLHANSIWDDSKDWMMSLREDERTLATYWDRDEGSNMPSNVIEISLTANALASDKGWVAVRYRFDNYDKCKAESDQTNTDGL